MPKKNSLGPNMMARLKAICQARESLGLSKVEKALNRLNLERQRQDLKSGEVKTILILDGHKKVNCYGQYLAPEVIFCNFNLNCAVRGVRTTCQISYPYRPKKVPSHHEGFFVKASDLGITANVNDLEEDFYVAIVNIKPIGNYDSPIFPFLLDDQE